MTPHTNPFPSTIQADEELGWLLSDFVGRVAGARAALLVSRDGLKLAAAGLAADQADRAAALISSLYALARGSGAITATEGGRVRQVVVEHDAALVFVMSAGDASPDEAPGMGTTSSRTVGSVLGVLAASDADAGVVGYEMATLIKSVAEHLVTATRTGGACSGGDQ